MTPARAAEWAARNVASTRRKALAGRIEGGPLTDDEARGLHEALYAEVVVYARKG
jgi:hypothetical protein